MATKQQDKQHNEQERQVRHLLNDVIGRHVLETLGRPSDLHTVQVRQLWDDHYRVNIFVGGDVASARVAHSYFLVADGTGNIVTSNPKVTKKY
jgi:hypothetical protein